MKPSKGKRLTRRATCLRPNSLPLKKTQCINVGPMQATLEEVERAIRYDFHDRSLLKEALTHSSCLGHASYQRLEFVGDAALNLAFANYLYQNNPDLGPGELSSLRAANISTEKLARAAVRVGLYRFVLRNTEELDRLVEEFTRAVKRERGDEIGGLSYGGSSKKAPKVLADIVESIIAAVYIDSNMNLETVWMVSREILAPIITSENLDEQPVTTLYQRCQKHGMSIQFKNSSKRSIHIMKVFVDGELIGYGSSEKKHIAKLNAAREALQHLSSSDESAGSSTEESSCLSRGKEETEGAKKMLNELCSKRHWQTPKYRLVKEQGPAHDKRFTYSVEVTNSDGRETAIGDAKSRKKDAENDAASRMLSKIGK